MPLDPSRLQLAYEALLCAAFWVAVLRVRGGRAQASRFVPGLALGAAVADTAGLLFTPTGLLLTAPWHAAERRRYLEAALPVLPLAFATAKLGCVAAGCCAVAGAEAVGFAAVAGWVHRRQGPRAGSWALAGIGLVRLVALPFRPEAALSALPASVWLALGALGCRPDARGPRCPHPGSAISRPQAGRSKPGSAAGSATRASSA